MKKKIKIKRSTKKSMCHLTIHPILVHRSDVSTFFSWDISQLHFRSLRNWDKIRWTCNRFLRYSSLLHIRCSLIPYHMYMYSMYIYIYTLYGIQDPGPCIHVTVYTDPYPVPHETTNTVYH